MKINELIKKIRKELGKSQEQLGRDLGEVTKSFISQVESGKKALGQDKLEKMIKKFPMYQKELEQAHLEALNVERPTIQLSTSNVDKIEITNFIEIPLYGLASVGNGKINCDEEIEKIVLPKIYETLS